MRIRSEFLVAVPVIWLIATARLLELLEKRENLNALRSEHASVQAGITEGGDSLSDLFEYKAAAAFQYVDAMETFLAFGCVPAFVFSLALVLTKRRPSAYDTSSKKFREELT